MNLSGYYAISIVPLCVIIVTPGIFYLFYFLTCSDEQECQCFADSLFQRKNIHNLVRKIFRVFDKGDREDQTLFSDYVVPHRFIYKLLFVAVFISGLVSSVFWLKFLIKDTFNCDSGDPSIDCFSEDNGTYGNSIDCSDNNATDIICFKFVLEIGEAVGTAGGLLTICTIVFGVISWVLLALSGGRDGGRRKHMRAHTCQIGILVVALFVFTGIILAVHYINSTTYEEVTRIFEVFVLMEVVAISSLCMPFNEFKKKRLSNNLDQERNSDDTDDTDDTDDDSNLINPIT